MLGRLLTWVIGLLVATIAGPAAATVCALSAPGTTMPVKIAANERSTLVHTPSGYRGGRMPVLFVLHGSGGNGADILRESGLAETSDRHGFLLVAPDGGIRLDRAGGRPRFVWNIPGVPATTGRVPEADDADDVAFFTAAIDWLVAIGCADRARIYVTGLSGGGRMASWLGCVASDRIAGIAPVVGLRAGNPLTTDPQRPDSASCRPARPMPVIAFAGDRDKVNPIAGGGAGYWQYSMSAALARWATLNGCDAGPLHRDLGAALHEQLYTRCRADAQVVSRVTRGAGHIWTADNEAMWAFLARYRRG